MYTTRLRGMQIKVLGHMWVIFTFTCRTAAAAIVLVFGMLGSTASVFAQVNPGDVLVADISAGTRGRGALFSINPSSGKRTVISDFGNAMQGDDLGVNPIDVDIDVDSSGNVVNILVIDSNAGTAGRGALFSIDPSIIDPSKRNRTLISDFGNASQGRPRGSSISSVALEASGNILVTDFTPDPNPAGTPFFRGVGFLFRIDTNGNRKILSNFDTSGQSHAPRGMALDASGNIWVVDTAAGTVVTEPDPDVPDGDERVVAQGALFRIDPSNGNRTLVSDFGNAMQGTFGEFLLDVAVDASGNVWVLDSERLFRVDPSIIDPSKRNRTVISSNFFDENQGTVITIANDVALDASGNILVTGFRTVSLKHTPSLFSINPTTGIRTVIHDFDDRTKGEPGFSPFGLVVVPTPPPTQPPVDLTISDMEITQAIQNFRNDVPLVQDKSTYVRVYPKVDIADRRVGARLRGFRDGAELPGSPLRPLYPLANVHTARAAREKSSDSFNFWIPPEWRSGKVSFQAEINFGGGIPETNPNNNSLSVEREFTRKAPVCVVMIPVRTHGSRYTVDSPGFDSIIARFGSLWPVPHVWDYFQSKPIEELQARVLPPFFEYGPYEMTEGFSVLNGLADKNKVIISLIARAHFTDDPDECEDNKARTHYVGMVSPDTNTGTQNGLGNYVFATSWVKMETGPTQPPYSTPQGGGTMAHELSHNYNGPPPPISSFNDRWLHVNCGDPDGTNDFYPYSPDTLGPPGNDTFWGFDPINNSRAIIDPGGAADYMSYCYPRWVSDYTWEGMFDEINTLSRARVQSLETVNEPAALAQSAEILVVGGAITPTANLASFEFAYRLSQGIMSARKLEKLESSLHSLNVSAPAYVLELVDTKGAVLFAQPFDSTGSYEDDPAEVFSLTVPFDPKTARIRIARQGQVLGSLAVSANPPEVRLLQPIGGETITDPFTIQWEASDQDNDPLPLLYTVQYSADMGASWQALVTQTPETSLTLEDTLSLKGSDQALIRVIANDGINTGSATSEPFALQRHMPVVHINTPANQDFFVLDSQVILMGSARDAEDGPLNGETLKWSLNGEAVGSGEEAAVGGLAPGTYEVTLEATDSDNNKATASVTITVADQGLPVASADGYETPANTPLQVEAPGVLANDTDAEGDPLSATLVSNVNHGTLALNVDGSFSYTPDAHFIGADSFTYNANDGTADSNVVTVNLMVTGTLVDIDIKPRSDSNPINPNKIEIIPVAILTTDTFDATQVAPLSVEFGPNGATEIHGRGHVKDADRDGDMDLILHFETQDTGIECGDTSATLAGETLNGQAIEGTDSITTVGCKDDGS